MSSVLDDLGSLISEVKNKNEEVELFVSELAPSLNESIDNKISNFNDKLDQWSSVNGIKVIKMNLSFKLGTGEVDEMCYEAENGKAGTILNRYGTLRLLSVINKQCKCLKAKEKIEASDSSAYPDTFSPIDRNMFKRKKAPKHPFEGQNSERRNMRPNYYRRPEYRQQYQQPGSHYFSRTFESSNSRVDEWKPTGCFNCGEYNHRQTSCRYDHRIRCNHCFKFGHKSRMCTLQNC